MFQPTAQNQYPFAHSIFPSPTEWPTDHSVSVVNEEQIKEDFLHFVWRRKKFNFHNLRSTQGEAIQIISFGEHNHDAGPDFTNARIKIRDTLWAGNVEIHRKSSEWHQHGHHKNKAYDNVILHVVLEEDTVVHRASGERIPCIELRQLIPTKLAARYLYLQHNESRIPCQSQLHRVPSIVRETWLDRLMVERLEQKVLAIEQSLQQNQYNWEESFYHFLARNFGVKVNAIPFELLARSLPLSILRKHKNQLFQIEALLFGQAGLLNQDFEESYPKKLKKEYLFLQQKYRLKNGLKESWKYLRLRPANFPTVRIAQFAQLIFQSNHLFSKALAIQNEKEIHHMFDLKVGPYWSNHYVFDKASIKKKKSLGSPTIRLIIINTICPFLFYYGQYTGNEIYQEKALDLLEQLPPEKNKIIQQWENLGLNPVSAHQSQALLQLKNEYCNPRKCLNCAIGNTLLK
ncbi:MAG: DUF2851 family protein [Bacteroidota bacterium]